MRNPAQNRNQNSGTVLLRLHWQYGKQRILALEQRKKPYLKKIFETWLCMCFVWEVISLPLMLEGGVWNGRYFSTCCCAAGISALFHFDFSSPPWYTMLGRRLFWWQPTKLWSISFLPFLQRLFKNRGNTGKSPSVLLPMSWWISIWVCVVASTNVCAFSMDGP